jgi:hypothetical protein
MKMSRPKTEPRASLPERRAPTGKDPAEATRRKVERIQTGVRMERRLVGVLKALADLHGISLGDLLEGIVLHAFEGKAPFSPESLVKIRALKEVFGLDLGAVDSHLLVESTAGSAASKGRSSGART